MAQERLRRIDRAASIVPDRNGQFDADGVAGILTKRFS
jgi:hypothetical protein